MRAATAWMGTTTAFSWVSEEMRTSALIPGRPPGSCAASDMRTGKVVTSASVPWFLMLAFFAISTTVAGHFLSGKASTSTSALSPRCT